METLLVPEPVPVPEPIQLPLARREAKPSPVPGEPYYVVTVYHDQGLATGGVWRLHFIFDPGPKEGTKLLTLLDETHSTMLVTMVIPIPSSDRSMFKIVTPLQRLFRNQMGTGGLWAALEDADD